MNAPLTASSADAIAEARQTLNRDGYVVIEGLLPRETVRDLKDRCERIMAHERAHPFDNGDGPSDPGDSQFCSEYGPFVASAEEAELVQRRIRADRHREFDTPWPVPPKEVCISFFHLPTIFDEGRPAVLRSALSVSATRLTLLG